MMKSVAEWIEHWDGKAAISNPVELNGYCIDGKPIALDTYRQAVIEPWVQRLELEPHHHVLDIGCGSGLMLDAMVDKVARCVGVDASRTMIERYKGRAETMLSPADRLPFADESFDRIIIASMAHYFPSLDYFEAVLRRCPGLLRRGGILLIADLPFGQKKPGSAYLFFDRHELVDVLDRIGLPYSIMVQARQKRAINSRLDIALYKD